MEKHIPRSDSGSDGSISDDGSELSVPGTLREDGGPMGEYGYSRLLDDSDGSDQEQDSQHKSFSPPRSLRSLREDDSGVESASDGDSDDDHASENHLRVEVLLSRDQDINDTTSHGQLPDDDASATSHHEVELVLLRRDQISDGTTSKGKSLYGDTVAAGDDDESES